MIELGINFEDNEGQDEFKIDSVSQETSSEENNIETDSIKIEKTDKETSKKKIKIEDNDDEIESIESIPFISKPVKKKSTRVKKINP